MLRSEQDGVCAALSSMCYDMTRSVEGALGSALERGRCRRQFRGGGSTERARRWGVGRGMENMWCAV